MRLPKVLRPLQLLLLMLLLPPSALATQVLSMTLEAMAEHADVIVHGRVVHTESVAVTDGGDVLDADTAQAGGHGRLRYETRVRLDVIETLKSDRQATVASAPLTFHLAGGRVGRFAQIVAGTPRVAVGDELVVMLERPSSSPILRVVGFSQGLWRAAALAGLGPLARSDRTGAELLPGPAGDVAPAVDVRPLDVLLSELRRLIAATAPTAPEGGPR